MGCGGFRFEGLGARVARNCRFRFQVALFLYSRVLTITTVLTLESSDSRGYRCDDVYDDSCT